MTLTEKLSRISNLWEYPEVPFGDLRGETLASVSTVKAGDDELTMVSTSGAVYILRHEQSCCESVTLEDVAGDLEDLVGRPVLLAEETGSDSDPEGYEREYQPESMTWTFYRLVTIKGTVVLRWFGESNGYYSEDVDMVTTTPPLPVYLEGFNPSNLEEWSVFTDGLLSAKVVYWNNLGARMAAILHPGQRSAQ